MLFRSTRGVLSVSTSATIGCRFPAWFTSSLILFLSPLFLLAATVSRCSALQFPNHDLQSVGLGMGLICGYWGFTLLMLGTCHADIRHWHLIHSPTGQSIVPQWFLFDQILCLADRHTRKHRSHVSFMRQDRMRRILNEQSFTVFILGAGRVSVPIGTL